VRPDVGDAAPEAEVLDRTGERVPLSSQWAARPAVVVFLRYFGCPFCQAQVVALREDRDRFEQGGGNVAMVGQGTPQECAAFCDRQRVSFPVFVDPDRAAFRAYGLASGTFMQVAGPPVFLPWLKNELNGETRQRGLRGGSFMQMPGTFVVDASGTVRLAHRNRHVADSPRNQAILDVLGEIARPG
jgi:prostamide/prostaglandin F2alpha synthase